MRIYSVASRFLGLLLLVALPLASHAESTTARKPLSRLGGSPSVISVKPSTTEKGSLANEDSARARFDATIQSDATTSEKERDTVTVTRSRSGGSGMAHHVTIRSGDAK